MSRPKKPIPFSFEGIEHRNEAPKCAPDQQDVFLLADDETPIKTEAFNWLPEEPWQDPGVTAYDRGEEAELDRLFGPLRG